MILSSINTSVHNRWHHSSILSCALEGTHLSRVAWNVKKAARNPVKAAKGIKPSYASKPAMAARPACTQEEWIELGSFCDVLRSMKWWTRERASTQINSKAWEGSSTTVSRLGFPGALVLGFRKSSRAQVLMAALLDLGAAREEGFGRAHCL
eukprot:1161886-Pelagomonas_calceolata.AAC.9